MINLDKVKWYCRNYTEIENYNEAISDKDKMWHCHHRKETDENKTYKQLIREGLYYNRQPEELIFLTSKEHRTLHNNNGETKLKISKTLTGHTVSEETRMKISLGHIGKKRPPMSEEQKRKISESLKRNITDSFRKKMSEIRKRYWENKCREKYQNVSY